MSAFPSLRVIGVDPGPVPGIVALDFSAPALLEARAIQCTPSAVPVVIQALIVEHDVDVVLAYERFVVGHRAGRSRAAAAGRTTRELIGALQIIGADARVLVGRSAAEVKPWATNERLEAAGLLEATKGMPHARDAARHALFAAVNGGHVPDPLSARWKDQNR